MKKKFKIVEYKPIYAFWHYEVEADNEDEALEMVQNGEVESVDYETDDSYAADFDYNVEEIK